MTLLSYNSLMLNVIRIIDYVWSNIIEYILIFYQKPCYSIIIRTQNCKCLINSTFQLKRRYSIRIIIKINHMNKAILTFEFPNETISICLLINQSLDYLNYSFNFNHSSINLFIISLKPLLIISKIIHPFLDH